ncbi:MAG TPA: FAD-dependent oxidoreductase, partial [Chloroflexota bacterium]
ARGLHTTWLIRGPRFLRRIIDDAGGELVDLVARSHGVETVYGEEVAEVLRKDGAVKGVVTTGGKHLDADLVGCGLGLTYNLELLANTPVEVNRGVVTNEYLETTVPGIFAAGDVAEYYDVTIGRHNIMGTWSSAASQGRTAGMNMVGAGVQYANVPLYTSMLFDLKLSAFGLTPESEPKLESVTKADLASRRYRRLFFLENRLVGGIIIGDNQEMKGRSKLMELIKSGCPVDDREALLHV